MPENNHFRTIHELELVYLPKGKYCVYPRMVYRLAIVMPPPHPFWMTENEFLSHFSGYFRSIWLDDRKSLSIAFLAISNQYTTLDDRKSLLIVFLAISDQYAALIFWILFTKWLPATILDDRKSLLIAFLAISDQYATFFLKYGCRRPFWMTENHFRSHFSF